MTTVYKFKAYYTDAGVGTVQDPAPTCTVINMADDSKLADAQATTASTNMPGLYSYTYSGADGLDCVAFFATTDTGCDVKQLASYVSDKITLIKDDTAAILADTGTDGVVIASAQTVATVTNLTNLPTMPTDWLTAAGVNADAVTKIQSGLALEATLTAIKGAYWTDESLANIMGGINAGFAGDDLGTVINALEAIKGAGWTTETLKSISDNLNVGFDGESITGLGIILGDLRDGGRLDLLIDAIKAKTDTIIAVTAQEVWEYATRVLTAGTNIDLSSLATAANLAATDAKIDAILEDTGTTLPASLTTLAGYTDGIAGDVWSHSTRTLTNQGVTVTTPATGDPLEIYRDTTVVISLTGLGTTTGYTKIWFTIKEDLEDLDTAAVLQITTADGLKYIDGETGAGTDGTLVIDNDLHTATITLLQASSASLPVYAAYPIHWDLKMLSNSVVSILAEGTIYIKSTPTRTIS